MSHLTKRIFAIAAAAALLAALSLPAAAHGGRHSGRCSSTAYCGTCTAYHAEGAHTSGGHHGRGHR